MVAVCHRKYQDFLDTPKHNQYFVLTPTIATNSVRTSTGLVRSGRACPHRGLGRSGRVWVMVPSTTQGTSAGESNIKSG